MRVADSIDMLGDARMQHTVLAWSWALMGAGIVGAVLLATLGPMWGLATEQVGPGWFALLACAFVAPLPIHEGIHALAFKLFSHGRAHVSFGFKDFMIYTTAHGAVLGRRAFETVLLAPAVIISLAFLVLGLCTRMPLLAWCTCAVHLSGCTGDLAMAREIHANTHATHVRDASYGIDLLEEE